MRRYLLYLGVVAGMGWSCGADQSSNQQGTQEQVDTLESQLHQTLEDTVTQTSKQPQVEALPEFSLVPKKITLENGKQVSLLVAEDYDIALVAEGMKKPRFPAWSPDQRLFVPDMQYPYDNTQGKIYVWSDFDSVSHRFTSRSVYLDNLRNPNSLAFYKDINGQQWLYIALTDVLLRFPYLEQELAPSVAPDTIATFADYGQSFEQGGWHLTRTLAFHQDKLYVSIGSSCNVCEEKEEERASIMEMLPDGTQPKIYADGLRNAVGLLWVDDQLYATNMGADHLGADLPDDQFCVVDGDDRFGWPWYYYSDEKPVADGFFDNIPEQAPTPSELSTNAYNLGVHTAPLGLAYFNPDSTRMLNDCFLIALHGSGRKSLKKGHSVVIIRRGLEPKVFIGGFLKENKRQGRPCGLLVGSRGDFLLTDDHIGVIYWIVPRS